MKPYLHCPHCGKPISASTIAAAMGRVGGKVKATGKGLNSEQAKRAARIRWDKRNLQNLPEGQLKRILAQAKAQPDAP